MTTTDLDALLAAADLSDRGERLMLADAYDEAGRPDDAAALRADDVELAREPHRHSEIMQPQGWTLPDDFGRVTRRAALKNVDTRFADHANGLCWEGLHPADRLWWVRWVDQMHEAELFLAGQEPGVRRLAEEIIAGENLDDLECVPDVLRRVAERAIERYVEAEGDE